MSYASGSRGRDYDAWSLQFVSAETSIPQITDLKCFCLLRWLSCLLHFCFVLRTRNSLWNFNHVLDNKFIWISGFELFGIIGGDSPRDDVWARGKDRRGKREEKKILKFRRRAWQSFAVQTYRGGFASRFTSWASFSSWCKGSREMKSQRSSFQCFLCFAEATNERASERESGIKTFADSVAAAKNLVPPLILIY